MFTRVWDSPLERNFDRRHYPLADKATRSALFAIKLSTHAITKIDTHAARAIIRPLITQRFRDTILLRICPAGANDNFLIIQ